MLKVGLIEVDRFTFPRMTFPNLALMKISTWHKERGDSVKLCDNPLERFDIVYQSKVFDETYSADIDWTPNADEVIRGGTGYGLFNALPYDIEHSFPDYHLYDGTTAEIHDTAYGFLTRGCPRKCPWCIVGDKEGTRSRTVADLWEFWNGQKNIKLLDPNLLACPDWSELLRQLIDSNAWVDFTQGIDIRLLTRQKIAYLNRVKTKRLHFAWDDPKQDLTEHFERYANLTAIKDHRRKVVYVLTNYNSTLEEDLYRIYTLEKLGYDPDVRVFDKPNAPKEIRRLQRWCNNRIIHAACPRFEDYKG